MNINNVWLYLLGIMIGGTILKSLILHPFVWVAIDILVMGICYLLLKRYPYIDLKKSMLFIAGITLINILVDLEILSGLVANIIILVAIGYILYKGQRNGGNSRPKLRHKWHK